MPCIFAIADSGFFGVRTAMWTYMCMHCASSSYKSPIHRLRPLRIGYGQQQHHHHHQQHSRFGQRWRVRDCVLRVHDVYMVVYSTSCVDAQPTRFAIHRRPTHTDAPSFPTLTPSRNAYRLCVRLCWAHHTFLTHTPQLAHAQKYRAKLLLSYE